MGFLLNNIEDVATKAFGTTVNHLKHDVYKYTVCGAWIQWDDSSVTIGSIVEGSEAEFDKRFEYPIDSDEIDHWIYDLEQLCKTAWEDANMNEAIITLLDGGYLYFKTESDDVEAVRNEFYNAMESTGVNADNLWIASIKIRDPYGNDI